MAACAHLDKTLQCIIWRPLQHVLLRSLKTSLPLLVLLCLLTCSTEGC